MATAYRYTGADARDYPTLGFHVEPGDVLYLDGRAPDDRFVEVDPGSMQTGDDEPTAADWRAQTHPTSLPLPEVPRPNKAAPQADWVEYAKADGSFQDATGVAPDDATRKAIVDHYYSFGGDQPADTEPAPAVEPTEAEPAAPVDDTPKEV